MKTLNIITCTLVLSILFYSCDKNEFAPVLVDQEFTVEENSPRGTIIGAVDASDADEDQKVTFAIIDGNEEGSFVIGSENGILSVADPSALDYESTTEFVIKVSVSDNHKKDPLESTAKIQVNLSDENEFAPVINPQVFELNENSATGFMIGSVVASDEESHQELSYSLLKAGDSDYFQLDPESGNLSVLDSAAFDFESHQKLSIQVEVSDGHKNPKTTQATIDININDVREITEGLAAYFPFDGSALDKSGNDLHGNLKGPLPTIDRFDRPESALELDGLDDNIAMTDDFDFQKKSVSLFFKPKSVPVFDYENNPYSSWSSLVICDHPSLLYSDIKILVSKIDGIDKVWIWKNGMAAELDPNILSAPISSENWNHIAVTYSSDSIKLFIDGQLIHGIVATDNIQSSSGVPYMVLGSGRGEKYRFFDGKADELYIHERVLEGWEIANLSQTK